LLYILTVTEYKADLEQVECISIAFESFGKLIGFMIEIEKSVRIAKFEIEFNGYNPTDNWEGVICRDA